MRAVGRRIADLRESRGITQAEAAELLETSVSNYQRIEHGHQNLTLRSMVRIASAFETTVAGLLAPHGERPSRRGRPPLLRVAESTRRRRG